MPSASVAGFQLLQKNFVAYIRNATSDQALLPVGVTPERAEVYRGLVFNNIKSFLDNNFPVLSSVVGEQRWRELAQRFVAEHSCQTPYFLEIGREFLAWLRDSGYETLQDLPFAQQLAHYEWVELAVAVAEDDPAETFTADSLIDAIPLISANAWSLRYDYPVHLIGPGFLPDAPGDSRADDTAAEQTFLLVYRDAQFDVQFMQINALTWLLLERLKEPDPPSAREVLQQMGADFPQLTPQQLLDGGEQTLQELVARGVIIGSRAV